MKVKRLTMQAFRGIDDLTLEFHPNVTVLVGVNGVGKSSILDCLTSLLATWIDTVFEKKDRELHFQSREDVKRGSYEFYLKVKLLLDSFEATFTTKALVEDDQFSLTYDPRTKADLSFKQIRDLLIRKQKNTPLVICYSVNRKFADEDRTRNTYVLDSGDRNYKSYGKGRTDFEDFLSWFKYHEDHEYEVKVNEDYEYRNIQLEAVRESISEFLPGFSNLRVRRQPQIRMTVEKQGQELIVNQLSDGEKCLLAMVGDIARRLAIANPGLPDPLQGEGIVLIDEIELHLHPQWQRGILPKLTKTFPNCQFIVTTHSPQVISDVQPESVIILESEDGKIVTKHPQSSFGRDSNQILEDLMDTPQRREDIQDKIQQLFRLIAESQLVEAKALQEEIAEEIGADEPELVGARAAIRRREILGK
ncbi:MAG TPA: AAA family ATPase [Thermosynechococcaceae cyanobacterium]